MGLTHIYVIGNGFDLLHGIPSRYKDFKLWIEYNHPDLLNRLQKYYSCDSEWWCDFEKSLGYLDIGVFRKDHYKPDSLPLNVNLSDLIERYSEKAFDKFRDDISEAFSEWINSLDIASIVQKMSLSTSSVTLYINFNYTDTLENCYNIPSSNVFHIHGRNSKIDEIIYGSNRTVGKILEDEYNGEYLGNEEEEDLLYAIGHMVKNTQRQINNHPQVFCKHPKLKYITIIGYSFSEVDERYLNVLSKYNDFSQINWRISYHTCKDLIRAHRFSKEFKISKVNYFRL